MDDVITATPLDTAVRAMGVHHVSINVDDLEAARAFYVDVLGFTERTDRPDFPGTPGAWLDVGGQQVHLIVADVPPRLGQHYAVLVENLDTAVDSMRERGVRVSDPVEVGTGLQSFTRDPCGNMVEIHEAGGVARRARS
jgi:catechol 2,3-dioxygenase-like lactoylglutathione lyase family enzyme